ncbi:MAG: hypothetical protein M1820_009913 [Bogoriella megaspora]|nr:MAG: hypothetical protein M1820_009913 [Bogoriella megaspora]
MTAPVAPLPKSLLGRHRVLSPTAAVKVSPLCLGAMSFGTAWKDFLGECNKETTFEILDYFYSQGGNFIDTANGYQAEQSETWIGEWLALHSPHRRDEMVIATKYTAGFKNNSGASLIQSNFGGNSAKSLHVSINASLRKLQTNYIDLLYVHYWDLSASIPEVMRALHHLVAQGKVLYLGISDSPAWVVVKANCYAREHGLTPFSVYQGKWSAADRDFEREIIPMCRDEGMGICPWGALGGGRFKAKGEKGGRALPPSETGKEEKVAEVLQRIAGRKWTTLTSVALAYLWKKTTYAFPIVGGRTVEHLKANIEALQVNLEDEDVEEIEKAYPFDLGFPMNFLGGGVKAPEGPQDVPFTKYLGHFDYPSGPSPIPPHKGPPGDG